MSKSIVSSKKVSSSYSSKTTSSSTSYSVKSSSVNIKSNSKSFLETSGKDYGLDVGKEMEALKSRMDDEMIKLRKEMHLVPLEQSGSGGQLVKLDSKSIMDYVDKADKDRFRFNFDVHEFANESISVKTEGNKIEVHAKKNIKKGDGEEHSEEYSRTYELPSSVDSGKVTSSVFKDGVLTVELPVNAIEC